MAFTAVIWMVLQSDAASVAVALSRTQETLSELRAEKAVVQTTPNPS